MKTAGWLLRGFIVSAISSIPILGAADLPGAQDFLNRIAAERGQSGSKTNQPDARVTELRQSLTNFVQHRAEIAPAEAATRWTDLTDKTLALSSAKTPRASINFTEVLAALPEPPAWPELDKIWDKRPVKTAKDLALRVIVARLVNQPEKARAAVDAFAKRDDSPESYAAESLSEILNRGKVQTREGVLKQLDRLVAASARGESGEAELPRLTPALSEDEAIEALKKALPKFKTPVMAQRLGHEDYAWKAALAVVDQLPIPQWGLIQSPNAAPLFEALEKKFGTGEADDDANLTRADRLIRGGYQIEEARRNYMVALIRRGDIDKAVQIARKSRGPMYFGIYDENEVPADKLAAFYFERLKRDPSANHWNELSVAAARAGMTAEALKLAEESIKKPDLSDTQRAALKRVIMRAQLADDQVDAALASFSEGSDEKGEDSTTQLAMLGAALKKPELMKRAAKLAAEKIAAQPAGRSFGYTFSYATLPLLLARNGLADEAIDFAVKALAHSPGSGGQWLAALCTIYIEEGRPNEALVLLENSPDWGIDDVAKTLRPTQNFNHGYTISPYPIHYIAAAALAGAGRQNEALNVLHQSLLIDGGNDRAYELLLKLADSKAIETLDELFALDRFEERPLIWKAILQQRAGNLDAAEKTVRQAIAIDPSDGEQGPGDRLRAYAVLADIRAQQGDQKQAGFLRGAVKAIRLSEEADLDYAAGLLRRAIGKYRQSLTLFADAYCVQARLAVQMAAIGLNDEAEEHYRRAFELMPDSFGRVESHCFGCEHAFGGEKAQGIAEKVFTGLLQKSPDKAQLHYLMGYLRKQQNRDAEAVVHLKNAVKLDPDYLNAWKLLAQISETTQASPQESDEAALNLIRLDPAGRHGGGYSEVADLARLWAAVKAVSQKIPVPPAQLLRLPASAEQLEKSRVGPVSDYFGDTYMPYGQAPADANPALAVAKDPVISGAAVTIGSFSRTVID